MSHMSHKCPSLVSFVRILSRPLRPQSDPFDVRKFWCDAESCVTFLSPLAKNRVPVVFQKWYHHSSPVLESCVTFMSPFLSV